MKKLSRKKIVALASTLIICMVLPIIFVFTSSAEMVEVYTTPNDLQLEWKNIWGEQCQWTTPPSENSQLLSQANGEYIMQTDAMALWGAHESISYAYTKAAFNTGEGSVMTIKVTIDEFEQGHEIGLDVRENVEPGAKNYSVAAFKEDRGTFIRYAYRQATNSRFSYLDADKAFEFGTDKIHLKMVLDKTTGRISGYYKIGGDIHSEDGWTAVMTKSAAFIKQNSSVYVGISVASGKEGQFAKGVCSNFSINLMAPEGYVVEDDGSSGEDTEDKEPEIVLPEDDSAVGDALLYETFTDGNIFPSKEESSVANSIWTVRSGIPTLQVDDAKTNRSLKAMAIDEPLMMTAGDMEWTDYSAQMEFQFSADALIADKNQIDLFFRHRSFPIGGSADYSVAILNKYDSESQFIGQYLQLRWRGGENTFIPSKATVLQEVCLSETGMIELGVTHTLKVNVLDNVYNVYLDDMTTPIIRFTDINQDATGAITRIGNNNEPHLEGCIGIGIQEADVQIDNIVVRKLHDYLGGDYDNEIMGHYKEPTPDWLAERYGY